MATDAEMGRWWKAALNHGYDLGQLSGDQIKRLLDAGLLVAPPAPPPEVTFRARAYLYNAESVYVSNHAIADATRGHGFSPGAMLEVTVRQLD